MPKPHSRSAARTTARGRCAAGCCARWPGLDFDEQHVAVDDPSTRAELLLLSPSFLVPCLTHDGVKVWDTLAIAEYLNELKPEAGLLPTDRAPARPLPLDLRRDAFRLHQPALGAADEPQGALSRLQGLGRRAGRHRPHHRDLARVPRRATAGRFCSASSPWRRRHVRAGLHALSHLRRGLDPRLGAVLPHHHGAAAHAGMDRRRQASPTSWKSSTWSSRAG